MFQSVLMDKLEFVFSYRHENTIGTITKTVRVIFSKARLILSSLKEEGVLRFQNNVNVTASLCSKILEVSSH